MPPTVLIRWWGLWGSNEVRKYGERRLELEGILWVDMETSCSRNSSDSLRKILVRTSSHGGYEA